MSTSHTDPRDWTSERRAQACAERGLPLLERYAPAEVSEYKGVLIPWTSTLDDRITLLLDELDRDGRELPLQAWAHKGSCGFVWHIHHEIALDECIEIRNAQDEIVDCWSVSKSEVFFPVVQIDAILEKRRRQLRTMPYDEYLETDHWKETRESALAHYGDSCVLCGRCPVQVHHRTYERRGCEQLTDLIVLCGGCHEHYHRRAS